MKSSFNFKPKLLAVMLIVCAVIAATVSWISGLRFWILMMILVGAVLLNGLIATVVDKDTED
jgi:diacylglycerol kinase